MKTTKRFSIFLGIIALVVLIWFVVSGYARTQERPNVLFIIVDTLRSDHLGCYGYKKINTPNIDRIAREGTLFENAISQIPLTLPSHCSIFTSTYPQFNNVRDNGTFHLDKSAVTLAEIMQENGYATAAFVSSFILNSKFGLNQGFGTYDDEMEAQKGKRVIDLMDERKRRADEVTGTAIKWLKANSGKNFFLWVHYFDPHDVYNPPSPYKEIYKDRPYDGEIAFTDEYIGVLLSTLKELNLDKKTFIIFAADHGEGLGEHGESAHGFFVYDATLKVPLIFSYPGLVPEGKVIEGRVRLVDIMPTVLDFLKIKKNRDIQGESLFPLIKGKDKTPALTAYSESYYASFHFNWSPLISFQKGDWKYIRSSEPELYNTKDDPGELVNLFEKRKDVVEGLDKELDKFLEKTTFSRSKETGIQMDEETKEKLMSLGYIGAGIKPVSEEPVPRNMIQIMEKINTLVRMANEGLVEEAIKGFEDVLKVDPDNIEANLRLAQCYKDKKNYAGAIKYFKKAASFKPQEPELHDALGDTYKNMGKIEEAFKEFEIALDLDKDNPEILNNMGWYYQQKLQPDRAMVYYQRALEIDPGIAGTHTNMAICHRLKGDIDKAMEELDIAVKLDPQSAFAYSELCACTATKGDLEKAISYCQKAIEIDSQSAEAYNNLGVIYERKGEYDKALENYLRALEIFPWSSLLHCNIANIYIQQKDFKKAREHLQKALEIGPDYPKAKQLLKLIPADFP